MVVADDAVIGRVVDVQVDEAIDVVGRRECGIRDLELLLHRGAVARRHVRPARGRVEVDPLIGDAECVRARGLTGQVVIEEDAAVREEGPEVDDRALERRHEVP